MRKHFYLIIDDERRPETVGKLEIVDARKTPSEKNEETVHHMADWTDGSPDGDEDRWVRRLVSCGYADFVSREEYRDQIQEVSDEKLAELDESHLEKAGIADALRERGVIDA